MATMRRSCALLCNLLLACSHALIAPPKALQPLHSRRAVAAVDASAAAATTSDATAAAAPASERERALGLQLAQSRRDLARSEQELAQSRRELADLEERAKELAEV